LNIVDANVLLYAVNTDAVHHEEARTWLDRSLSGDSTVAFSWVALLAFVRLSTKLGLFPSPLTVEGALARVDAWLTASPAVVVEPTWEHSRVIGRLLGAVGIGGDMVNDAHLAALSIEHRGTVVSYDNDFSRFPGVDWKTP
jgi:uncharacterized protein